MFIQYLGKRIRILWEQQFYMLVRPWSGLESQGNAELNGNCGHVACIDSHPEGSKPAPGNLSVHPTVNMVTLTRWILLLISPIFFPLVEV